MTDKRVLILIDGQVTIGGVRYRLVPENMPLELCVAGMRCTDYTAMLSAAAIDLSGLPRVPPDPEIDRRIFASQEHQFAWTDGWLSALIALGVK